MHNSIDVTPGCDLQSFSRRIIGQFPTAVRKITLDDGLSFWVKDDGACGTAYGGNKVRKLEYLLPWIDRSGKKKLVLQGDMASHTVMASALYGRQYGFEVTAVVYPGSGADLAPANKMFHDTGTRVIMTRNMISMLFTARLAALVQDGYLVPLSATTPISTLGYVRGAFELLQQIRNGEMPPVERIFVPFATGGTVAGLLCGFALARSPIKVVAVQTTESIIGNLKSLKRHLVEVLRLLGNEELADAAVARLETLDIRYLGKGHRQVTPESLDAQARLGEKGLHLDLAFTAKAMAALLASLADRPADSVLFWNTHDQGFESQTSLGR